MADGPAPEVRLVVLGRSATRLPCPPGATLGTILAAAGVETAGRDVHVDGRPRTLAEPVRPGEIITVIPRVRGGMRLCTIEREQSASEVPRRGERRGVDRSRAVHRVR